MNNAGIRRVGDIELIPLEQTKRVAEVNLYGTVRVTKAFIPLIRKSKGNLSCLGADHLIFWGVGGGAWVIFQKKIPVSGFERKK